jgi:flagella basal body P-ring formation protein FlgA
MKWIFAISLARCVLACQVVEGEHILGRDLASANALFSTLDPAAEIAPAPLGGVRRVLLPADLLRLAERNGITLSEPLAELCFERATERLTAEGLQPVLEKALGLDGARLEILDFSRAPIPRGTLEFTRTGLSPGGLWRGHVAYSQGRTAPVWAKVRVTTEQTWVEAVRPLPAGQVVDASGVAVRAGPRSPFGPAPLPSVELAAGKMPLRTIQPGIPISASMLIAPREIERGDKVMVEVLSGAARLSFEATAESSGRAGDAILVRNPSNGRLFPARIAAKGKVRVKL